ncbi:hypothetical protein YC2023_081577 [Brassica napus]
MSPKCGFVSEKVVTLSTLVYVIVVFLSCEIGFDSIYFSVQKRRKFMYIW